MLDVSSEFFLQLSSNHMALSIGIVESPEHSIQSPNLLMFIVVGFHRGMFKRIYGQG